MQDKLRHIQTSCDSKKGAPKNPKKYGTPEGLKGIFADQF